MVKILTRYDYEGRPECGVNFDPKVKACRSRTIQSERDSCDINILMAKYEKQGILTGALDVGERVPMFGDFSDIGDYHSVMSRVAGMQSSFNAFPASVRSKFDNDPQKALDFIADPKNAPEAVKLGMLPASVLPKPVVKPEVLTPTPTPALQGAGAGAGGAPAPVPEVPK